MYRANFYAFLHRFDAPAAQPVSSHPFAVFAPVSTVFIPGVSAVAPSWPRTSSKHTC